MGVPPSVGLSKNYLSTTPHRTSSVDLSAEGLGKAVLRFRQSKYFRPFYLGILGLVVTGLFYLTGGSEITFCLGALAMPAAVLVIPYWLGERSLKNFAINAAPVFVIALLLVAAFQTNAILSQGPPALTSGNDPLTPNRSLPHFSFWDGTVEPYQGAANQNYTFRVRLKVVNATGAVIPHPSNLTIVTNLSQSGDLLGGNLVAVPMLEDPSQTNFSNGTWYIAEQKLPSAIYAFRFWVNDTNANNTVVSSVVLGPLNASSVTYYLATAEVTLVNLIFPVSFYFIIVFMYWYTIRMRRMRERMAARTQGEKLDFEKPPAKGGGAKEDAGPAPPRDLAAKTTKKKPAAFTCTNCGADVTEDDAKCPKCGAVFED